MEAFMQRWTRRMLWAPLGVLLLILPASPLLLVLQPIYSEDAQDSHLTPMGRFFRRLPRVLMGISLGLIVLTGELLVPLVLALLLPRVLKFHLSPWLVVPLGVYLIDLIVLCVIGKVPLGYNFRNLTLRWITTGMTALAFTLVIGLLTTLMAFVNGMDRLTENSGQPGNVIVLSDGANDEVFSTLVDGDMSDVERHPSVLKESDLDGKPRASEALDNRLASKEVYLVVNQPIPPDEGTAADQAIRGTIRTITPDRDEFVLVDDLKGDVMRLRMAEGAKIFSNRSAAKFDELRLGDKVWVAYEAKGKEYVATEVRAANKRRFVQVRGIDDGVIAGKVHGLPLMEGGSWFSEAGVDDKKPGQPIQAVLGEGVARELGHDLKKERLEVDDVFELGPRKWVVVGIMQSAGSTFGSEIWAKRGVVGPLFGKFPNYSSIVLRTRDASSARELADYLTKDFKKTALNAQTESEYYSKLSETNRQFSVAIWFVTIVMAIGGVLGVMNTMFAAISQRTKDIGVMRIVGFANWHVLVSFLLESLVIGLIGGLIGAVLAYVLFDGWTATSIVSSGQGGGKTVVLKLTVTLATVASGLLITLVMGRIGGLLPALSAMRLKPLESLR
jgi:ABC-type lipoprotein release transport system permease subunit